MENSVHVPARIRKWYKKKRWWLAGAFGVLLVGGGIYASMSSAPKYETMVVSTGDLVQEVNVTGKVQPAEAVDLQFEASGRIATLNVKAGDQVRIGQVLASLDNSALQAGVLEAEAGVLSAQADLDRAKIALDSLNNPGVSSSLKVELENAEKNLGQVKTKADGDLATKYNGAVNTIREAVTSANASLTVMEELRQSYFQSYYTFNDEIKRFRDDALYRLDQVKITLPLAAQIGGAVSPSMYSQIDTGLTQLLETYQTIRNGFNYMQNVVQDIPNIIGSDTDRAKLASEAAAVSSKYSAVSATAQGLADQKILNQQSISSAEARVASAQAAFPTAQDIAQKEAALKRAQATLVAARANLRKSSIIAPFAGVVGRVDAERGQTVGPSNTIISLISSAGYEIEANVTEIDIGKVQVGQPANLTLDAYGNQRKFNAVVSAIDTGAASADGLASYKTTLAFEGEVGVELRPNMTADVYITTGTKSDVIAVPQRAVISRNGIRFVRMFKGDKVEPEEREVTTGLLGRDGRVEILSGLSVGETIITFVND